MPNPRWAFALILLVLTACTPWRNTYLAKSKDHAKKDEVTKRMGPPHFTRALDAGGEVWTYQYRSMSISGRSKSISGQSYCIEYILRFDEKRILREWRGQGC